MTSLETAIAKGRNNNFDIVRLVAAMGVVVSHAWPLSLGAGTVEPMEHATGVALGGLSVFVFFFLSGLLVTESAHRWSDRKLVFVVARVGRIFPGLFVALLVTVAIAAISGGDFGMAEAGRYIAKGLSLISIEHSLTGAFADTPYPGAVNGPLWTLFYEVLCYIIIAGLTWVGILSLRIGWAAVMLGIAALYVVISLGMMPEGAVFYRLTVFAPLAMAFAMGGFAWRIRALLPLSWIGGIVLVALTALTLIVFGEPAGKPILIFTCGYGCLLIAYCTPPMKMPGDISYGVYIYGWPVTQLVVWIAAPASAPVAALLSALAVVPFAAASWVMVEKPMMMRVQAWRRRRADNDRLVPN
ncbi:MAG: acyltransferase family protein [Pikeienuella sp.]